MVIAGCSIRTRTPRLTATTPICLTAVTDSAARCSDANTNIQHQGE